MNEEYRIFFHLGLPKVASTYLQRDIFPNLTGARFYRKHKFRKYKTITEADINSHIIFSSEMDRGLEKTLDDILHLHPEARVIYLLRSHDDWVLSRYKYHIRKFGSFQFKEFIDIDSDKGHWKIEELLFARKIEYIKEHCKHPPLILDFELLKSSPEQFIKAITDYTGCSLDPSARTHAVRNKSMTEKQLLLLRKFNRIYKYRKKKTKYRMLNRAYFRYRQYLLHVMAFLFRFFPASTVTKPLVDQNELIRIREFYKDDWEACLRNIST